MPRTGGVGRQRMTQAAAMAATCRSSVPQQPPSTVALGSRSRSAAVLLRELVRVALVELLGRVQLLVAHPRRVRADAADPLQPRPLEHALEVGRMRAVDHEVGGRRPGLGVDLLDRRAQWLPAREPAVDLDRERDRRRQPGRLRRPRDADGLVGVRHRDRADHVGGGARERADLLGVVGLGLLGSHRLTHHVAVPRGPMTPSSTAGTSGFKVRSSSISATARRLASASSSGE